MIEEPYKIASVELNTKENIAKVLIVGPIRPNGIIEIKDIYRLIASQAETITHLKQKILCLENGLD